MRMSRAIPTSLTKPLLEHGPIKASSDHSIILHPRSCPASVSVVCRVRHVGINVNLGHFILKCWLGVVCWYKPADEQDQTLSPPNLF